MGRNAVALVMLGASVSASSPALVARADTPLVDAVKRHDRAAVERLLTDGADVDAAQPDGATALHWAVHALGARTTTNEPRIHQRQAARLNGAAP